MEKVNVKDVLYRTCVKDLCKISDDAKMWYVEHVYGDYEMPLYFYIDSNNMLVGANRDFNRFYVGKVGEKSVRGDGEVVAPINLWFMDHHRGTDYLGNDKCHEQGLQNYRGEIYFYGNKATLWGAHGKHVPYNVNMLPSSNGSLYQDVVSVEDGYLQSSLKAYVYANFMISVMTDQEVLPLVETISELTLQSNDACSPEDFALALKEHQDRYTYDDACKCGPVYCKTS